MPILAITSNFVGLVGVTPSLVFVNTTDTFAEVTAAGYITNQNGIFYTFDAQRMILVKTSDLGVGWYQVSIDANDVITLVPLINPGTVSLPVVSGNLASFTGTSGEIEDSGILASNVQLKSQVKSARSANIGGSSAGPVDIAVTGATASSIAVANIVSSSNAVQIQTVVPGTNKISVTFSADPGASAIVDYVVYLAAQ